MLIYWSSTDHFSRCYDFRVTTCRLSVFFKVSFQFSKCKTCKMRIRSLFNYCFAGVSNWNDKCLTVPDSVRKIGSIVFCSRLLVPLVWDHRAELCTILPPAHFHCCSPSIFFISPSSLYVS